MRRCGPERTAVDYIDAALAVAEFRDWIEAHEQTARMDPGMAYWPNDEGEYPSIGPYAGVDFPVVEMGLLYPDDMEDGFYAGVVLNRETLELVGTRFE